MVQRMRSRAGIAAAALALTALCGCGGGNAAPPLFVENVQVTPSLLSQGQPAGVQAKVTAPDSSVTAVTALITYPDGSSTSAAMQATGTGGLFSAGFTPGWNGPTGRETFTHIRVQATDAAGHSVISPVIDVRTTLTPPPPPPL